MSDNKDLLSLMKTDISPYALGSTAGALPVRAREKFDTRLLRRALQFDVEREPSGHVHVLAKNPSTTNPVRFLAVIVGKQGSPSVLPK